MQRFVHVSLRVRLLLLTLGFIIPILALMLYNAAEQRQMVANEAQANALRLVRLGAAYYRQPISSLHELLAELPAGSSLTVMDRSGTVLARHPDSASWVGRSVTQEPLFQVILVRGYGTSAGPDIDGTERLFGFTELAPASEGGRAYLTVGIPAELAYSEPLRALARNLTVLSLVTVLALFGIWFGSELLLVRPVRALVAAAGRLAAGDLSTRTGLVGAGGELGQLARAFDTMAESLEGRVKEDLHQTRDRLQTVLDALPVAVSWVSADLKYLGLNRYLSRILALPVEAFIGQPVGFRGTSPELAQFARDFFAGPAQDASREIVSWIDGRPHHYLVVARKYQEGHSAAFVGMDITEQKRAEETLRISEAKYRSLSEQLRALAARLAEVEEAEQRRLAQELHDRLGQNLTALSLNLNIVRSQMPARTAFETRARLKDSLELVTETMGHVRDVMAELRPPLLDDYGLLAALRWYGERFARRTGLPVAVRGEELTPRLPSVVEAAIFRITQEALTNVARHARAGQVTLNLEPAEGCVRLTIADDGIGFDNARASALDSHHGWGLMTMAERAEGAGGRLRVESAPGQGTQIIVEVARD